MENTTPNLKRKKFIQVALITLASLVVIGAIGYGTVIILHRIKAPTLSTTSQQQAASPGKAQPTATPQEAQKIADDAYQAASKKAEAGDQKAALVDYKKAYENYKIAHNTTRASDVEFIIKSVEAVLAAPKNPAKPSAKVSAKE